MRLTPIVLFLVTIVSIQCTDYRVTDEIEFEITSRNQVIGNIRIGLFGDICPKTVKNFKALCSYGVKGRTYVGSEFHRIIEKFMIQGGDIVNGDGTGSCSIFGESFPDENFDINHSCPGMVSMANSGPNTNGCQFFITTVATPFLDGKHVVFGKVTSGQDIVHTIEHMKRDSNDRPLEPVFISKSRVLQVAPFWVSDEPYKYY